MIYAKVDVDLRDNRKARLAGEAMATWTYGLLYSRGQELDGFVDREALRGGWVEEKTALRHAATLVLVGLWEVVDGGWKITNFSNKNDTKEVIDARKEIDRVRKAEARASKAMSARSPLGHRSDSNGSPPGIPGLGTGTGLGTDLSSVRDPDPTSTPREPARFEAGSAAAHRASEVFSDAVGAATGGTFVLDRAPFTAKDICTAMGHAPKGATLTQALDWLTPTVGEWVASGEARPLTPRRFNDWLNERNAPKRPVSFVRTKNADRQPHDEGWLKRMREREAAAGTGTDDPFGGNS